MRCVMNEKKKTKRAPNPVSKDLYRSRLLFACGDLIRYVAYPAGAPCCTSRAPVGRLLAVLWGKRARIVEGQSWRPWKHRNRRGSGPWYCPMCRREERASAWVAATGNCLPLRPSPFISRYLPHRRSLRCFRVAFRPVTEGAGRYRLIRLPPWSRYPSRWGNCAACLSIGRMLQTI
jgi:hypothetical protein